MLGNRLKGLRNKKGMTQKELADMLGVTDGAIGMWERGRREPDGDKLSQLARIFGVSVDYLLGHSDNPKADPDNYSMPDSLEEFLSQQGVKFDGVPLTDDDRQRLLLALKLLWRRHYDD